MPREKIDFTNSTFVYNTAVDAGAILLTGDGVWQMTNVTAAYNETTTGATYEGAISVTGGNFFGVNDLFVYNDSLGVYDDLYILDGDYNSVFRSIYNTSTSGIFVDAKLADYGGWTKTLAISAGGAAHNAGYQYGCSRL